MKSRWIITAMIMLAFLLSACKAEEGTVFEEVFPTEQGLFRYEGTGDAEAIAVDKEGLLYAVSYIPEEDRGPVLETEYVYQTATQRFRVYDLEGNCILEKDVGFGNGWVYAILEEEGKLYCVAGKSVRYTNVPYLYVVDTKTWKVKELCELEGYSEVTQIVHIGEYFYFFGTLENPAVKSYVLHPDVYVYDYKGEAVCRLNLAAEQPRLEQLQVDFPCSIFKTANDTLMIYQYTEEYGFGLLEFSPEAQTLTEAGRRPDPVGYWGFTKCEDGYLYLDQRVLFFGTMDGEATELTAEQVLIWRPSIVYRKGFAFYQNGYQDNLVERICVADLVKENRTIHLLMHTDTQDKPFGCGYRMEKTVLPTEQYALKILAQDSDFDVFVLSTRNSSAYNLKENGAFYALNEVESVQKYLDACFPYIKELATNKDGDIWMIPVQLAIPAIFYNREYCERMGVDIPAMDFSEFLYFSEQASSEEADRIAAFSALILQEELFGQYLQQEDSFDTPLMKDILKQIKEMYDRSGGLSSSQLPYRSVTSGESMDFYYFYEIYQWDYRYLMKALGVSDSIGVAGVPKMEEGIGNVGTLTFLAVNPQAENLEAALDYISSFANYMIGQKDTFLLADESTYTDTPFVHGLYYLYANGAVRFAMDDSIFNDQYWKYLSDELTLEEMIAESERRRKIYVGE